MSGKSHYLTDLPFIRRPRGFLGLGVGRLMGGGKRKNATYIGPYPMPAADPLAAPKWYVDGSVSSSGNGLSWATAKKKLSEAVSAATAGDVIEISGGSSGQTYSSDNQTINKALTIQGSKTAGHNGLVTFDGRLYTTHTSGVVNFLNFKHAFTYQLNIYPMQLKADGATTWTDMQFGPWHSNYLPTINGNTHTFTRCRWHRITRPSGTTTLVIITAAANVTFKYCVFDYSAIIGDALPAGTSFVMENCLVLATGYSHSNTSWVAIGNSASTTVSIKKTAFFGHHPVASGANSVLTVEDVFWHNKAASGSASLFDTAGKASVVRGITCVDPKFTTPKNTTLGRAFVVFDDRNNLDISTSAVQTLNPEIKISHAVDCHSNYVGNRPSAEEIDQMRALIASGNDIACHSGSHSDLSSLNFMNIRATGTSPTLDIVVSQTGDSSTWTGTLTVTINGTPLAVDLSTYNTIGALVSYLNGRVVGDGTITCTKYNSQDNTSCESKILDAVSGQSISSNYVCLKNETAMVRVEVIEAIADLTAYINSAVDRNGANAIAGTTVPAPDPAYVCREWRSPYGQGRAAVETALINLGTIYGAAMANPANANGMDIWANGAAVNMYGFGYTQVASEADVFATACAAASGPYVRYLLYHGNTPVFNGTLAGFKALLLALDLGGQIPKDFYSYVRTHGEWSISEPSASFIGDATAVLAQGNFTPAAGSPLKLS